MPRRTQDPARRCRNFVYRVCTFFDWPFNAIRLFLHSYHIAVLQPQSLDWFGLFQFRSPLLSESFVYFLFLRVIRWFSSPGSPRIPMYSVYDITTLLVMSFLIRISAGQRSFATLRSFSQLVTSFFGAMYQGILLYALCSLFFLELLDIRFLALTKYSVELFSHTLQKILKTFAVDTLSYVRINLLTSLFLTR